MNLEDKQGKLLELRVKLRHKLEAIERELGDVDTTLRTLSRYETKEVGGGKKEILALLSHSEGMKRSDLMAALKKRGVTITDKTVSHYLWMLKQDRKLSRRGHVWYANDNHTSVVA